MNIKKICKWSTSFAAVLLLAGPLQNKAIAGPTMEFGPDGEGLLKIDYKAQAQGIFRDTGSGPQGDDSTSTMNFRRNRLQFIGVWEDIYSFYVQTDFVENLNVSALDVGHDFGNHFTLLDYQLRFNFDEKFRVRVGKFKANFARENLEDCYQPLTLDRSLFLRDPFVVSRDLGIAAWGNFLDKKLQYRFNILEGREADDVAPKSNFRYSGRLHISLLDPESGYGYRGTYRGTKKVLTMGVAGQLENDILYGDSINKTDSKDYSSWTADLFFEYPAEEMGTVTLSGAYVDVDLDDAYQGLNPESAAIGIYGEKNGYYVKAGYMLPNLPLQIFGRYEGWTYANLEGVINQDLGWAGVGANYYINGQKLKITIEYSETNFEHEINDIEDFSTVRAQLQVFF